MDNASSETGFRLVRLGEQVGHRIAEAHRVSTTKSCCTRWPCSAGERLMFRRNRLGFHAGMDKRVSCATWTQDKKKKNGSIPRSFFASVQLLQIVRAATRRSPCPSNSPFQLIIWARGRRGTPRGGTSTTCANRNHVKEAAHKTVVGAASHTLSPKAEPSFSVKSRARWLPFTA